MGNIFKLPYEILYPHAYMRRAFLVRSGWKWGWVLLRHVLHWVTTDLEMTTDPHRGLRTIPNERICARIQYCQMTSDLCRRVVYFHLKVETQPNSSQTISLWWSIWNDVRTYLVCWVHVGMGVKGWRDVSIVGEALFQAVITTDQPHTHQGTIYLRKIQKS